MRTPKCCVSSCRNKREDAILHKFPICDETRLTKWLECLNSEDLKVASKKRLASCYVCRKHFEKRFYSSENHLKLVAYPSLFTHEEISSGVPSSVIADIQSNSRTNLIGRARDDSKKGNASSSEASKRSSMDGVAHGNSADSKDDKRGDRDDNQVSSGVVSSTQDEATGASKRAADDDDEDEGTKRKKRKEAEDRELMGKPAVPVQRSGVGRVLSGSKLPGPASKTGAVPLGKGGGQAKGKGPAQGKGSAGKGKSGGKGAGSQLGKQDRKSPVASPKPTRDDDEEQREAPKVPPLKIVIPGGAGGAGGRLDQEGEGGSGGRGGGKGRGSASTLPYVIPCTSSDVSSSDGSLSHGPADSTKAGQRVLRSHRNDGEKERGKARKSPHYKSPHASGSGPDDHGPSSSSTSTRSESASASSIELHPRKRKIKASRESHSRDHSKADSSETSAAVHNVSHSNPYQMYIHIRKQIDRRQKALFPVKPKPPKDFNKYLMNRCTYTLQGSMNPEPQVEVPLGLPPPMAAEFTAQEKERTRLRVQHLVEKEKLVLAVEQEILRVHGRAERAVANQALPFSVCTMLRDKEVYNVLAPEQEEKRNAQRSRCNGRQINSWLQEVDDKWEKIKEGMLRRQHTEAETLHAVQMMGWEWKLKELALCDYKTTPKIDSTHVPQIHVSNFDLPA